VQDWRFGSLIRTQPTAISLGAGGTITIARNAQRVGLTITQGVIGATATLSIVIDGIGSMLFGGSFVSPQLHVTLATHGDLPTRQFVGTAGAAGFTGLLLEYIAPQEYITAAIEEFKRSYPKLFPPR